MINTEKLADGIHIRPLLQSSFRFNILYDFDFVVETTKNGRVDGVATQWKNGVIIDKTRFVNNKEHGQSITYYDDGKDIYMICFYNRGILNGDQSIYSKEGILQATRKYYNGHNYEMNVFYKSGNIKDKVMWDNHGGEVMKVTYKDDEEHTKISYYEKKEKFQFYS